jgi:hypothetical protein
LAHHTTNESDISDTANYNLTEYNCTSGVTFNLSLKSTPGSPVALILQGLVSADGRYEGAIFDAATDRGIGKQLTLTWAVGSYNKSYTLRVCGLNDDLDDGDMLYYFSGNFSSNDTNYDSHYSAPSCLFEFKNRDDDTSGTGNGSPCNETGLTKRMSSPRVSSNASTGHVLRIQNDTGHFRRSQWTLRKYFPAVPYHVRERDSVFSIHPIQCLAYL